ncbi:hypothetical protein EJB05_54324, partial [Eragrostis curvula]
KHSPERESPGRRIARRCSVRRDSSGFKASPVGLVLGYKSRRDDEGLNPRFGPLIQTRMGRVLVPSVRSVDTNQEQALINNASALRVVVVRSSPIPIMSCSCRRPSKFMPEYVDQTALYTAVSFIFAPVENIVY